MLEQSLIPTLEKQHRKPSNGAYDRNSLHKISSEIGLIQRVLTKTLRNWLGRLDTKTIYNTPGSPWENGYYESFNGKLGDELLNGELFYTLREARALIDQWRVFYNAKRPHSSLGYRLPAPETKIPDQQIPMQKNAA